MLTLRLAAGNVRKSWRDYAIYFVTLTFAVTLFYAFNTVDAQVDMLPQQQELVQSLGKIVFVFTWILVAILGFLVVYANNYLVRRRTKELALYQILGMRRRNVAAILTAETMLSSLTALAAGLGLGVLASQFLVFVTARIMKETVENYHFVFSAGTLTFTIVAFLAIFGFTLVLNLATLRRLSPIDLMRSGAANEEVRTRSPWISLALFAAGVALVGVAYWRLTYFGYPFLPAAGAASEPSESTLWTRFLVTTLMVFAGTYFLFFSFGGMVLHFARRSRRTYWRGLNMFTVRELASRVRTSAASMATISLVIFLMLGVVTSSFGLAGALADTLQHSAPHDLTFTLSNFDDHPENVYAALEAGGFAPDSAGTGSDPKADAGTASAQDGTDAGASSLAAGTYRPDAAFLPTPGEPLHGTVAGRTARWAAEPTWRERVFESDSAEPHENRTIPTIEDVIDAANVGPVNVLGAGLTENRMLTLGAVAASDYNAHRALAGLDPLDVPAGTFAVSFASGFDEARNAWVHLLDSGTSLTVFGEQLKPLGGAEAALDESAAAISTNAAMPENVGTLVVPDSVLADARKSETLMCFTPVTVDFDDELNLEESRELASSVREQLAALEKTTDGAWTLGMTPASRATLIPDVLGAAGMATYIAVYMGLVLAMASAAILAIKMLAQAADSAPRYRRLSTLGCPRSMADRSLAIQIGLFFALPLAVAAVHAFVAVGVFAHLLRVILPFSITNAAVATGLFVVAIYGLYYVLTLLAARTVLAQR